MATTIIVLLNLYIFILIARLLIQMVHADYFNPVCRFIYKATQPLLFFCDKIKIKNNRNICIIILLIVVNIIKLYLFLFLKTNILPNIFGVAICSAGEIAKYTLNIMFYLVIIRAILSWVSTNTFNSYTVLLFQITEPILVIARKNVPPIAGIDVSVIVILLLLKATIMIIANPMLAIGIKLAL